MRRTWPGCAPLAHTPRYLGERRPLSLACASSPTVRALGGIDLAVPDGDEKAEPFSDAPSARSSESPLCEARGVRDGVAVGVVTSRLTGAPISYGCSPPPNFDMPYLCARARIIG